MVSGGVQGQPNAHSHHRISRYHACLLMEKRMPQLRINLTLACATAMSFVSLAGFAQEYPNKLVRIVTLAPGGGSDVVARLVAPVLSEALGQQVIVENRGSIAG